MASEKETAERAPRDNRRIVSGVQLSVGAAMRTFAGDSAEVLDELEALLTPEQVERLKALGALEGDWQGRGGEAPPMKGSPLARAAGEGLVEEARPRQDRDAFQAWRRGLAAAARTPQ